MDSCFFTLCSSARDWLSTASILTDSIAKKAYRCEPKNVNGFTGRVELAEPFNGRRFRVLNVTDNFNRELVGQLIAFSISGERVARFLSELGETRPLPARIVVDNGTEFTSKAIFEL